MLDNNSLEYKERIENLRKYILSKDYGTTLTFDEVNEFIGENLKDEKGLKRFRNAVRKVKRQLYQEGYVLRGVMNIGYYILKPNQIAGYTYRNFMLKPINSFYTAQIILEKAKTKSLNVNDKEKHAKAKQLNEALICVNTQLLEDKEYERLKEG